MLIAMIEVRMPIIKNIGFRLILFLFRNHVIRKAGAISHSGFKLRKNFSVTQRKYSRDGLQVRGHYPVLQPIARFRRVRMC